MQPQGAGVVLATGVSARMSNPKALLDTAGGRTFLEIACGTLRDAGVQPILVVVEEDVMEAAEAIPKECLPVPNPTPELGEASSLALGLEAAMQLGKPWALVSPVDHPAVQSQTARFLAERASAEPGAVHVPTYKGTRGHPTAVPTALAPSLFEAQEGEGAREVFSRLGVIVREHPVEDAGVVLQADSPDDLRRFRSGERR
jgi:CTP:molybdopterin cytidylyltransferase MocA